MGLTFSQFDSFAEVVSHYNSITPLRGKDNVGKDIRPIGDRKRKFERIVKISANCYALSDGYHMGDEHFPSWGYGIALSPTLADMEKYAPVVWRKKRDGTEEVTLRNGWGPHTHNGRYAFLWRHTPKGMWFRNRNGKHFIQLSSPIAAGRDYYLAKQRTAPRGVYAAIRHNPSRHHWQKHMKDWARVHDCNSAVTFRKAENGWEHVEGTGRSLAEVKAPTVNKSVKAKYKDDIKKFFEWGMAMSPLLPLEDREYQSERSREFYQYFKPADYTGYGLPKPQPADLRKVVRDEDHPMRLTLWVMFASDCTDKMWGMNREYYCKTVQTKEDLQRVRSRYNTFINKQLGFMKK